MNKITDKDKIAVYFGPDNDGLCSSIITSEAIKRLRNRPIDLLIYEESNEPKISRKNIRKLKDNEINRLIVLDIAIDSAPEDTLEALVNYKTLVLDHHQTVQDLNRQGIIFVKPEFFSDIPSAKYPVSKLAYDLFSKLIDIQDLDWISSIGILSDSAYPTWKAFVDEVNRRHHLKTDKDIWKSDLGLVASNLHYAILYSKNNLPKCSEILKNSNSPRDILTSPIKKYKEIVERKIQTLINNFPKNSESYHRGDVILYEIQSRFDICSTLSTIISNKYIPNKTLIVIQPENGRVTINARRQDGKINLANIIRGAVSGFDNASGGGHIPAAGASINKKDLPAFKKNILKMLSEF